ncbi:MAG: nuclear transport factor 2 family protein [Actinomycetota bacterium]|nr:nuclear transport factor 2 family protein [Actinomycetota bacterium]
MTLAELDRWLSAYGAAWERRDADAFAALFSADAMYRWGPFAEPLHGRDEIRARVEQAVSVQADVRFGYEPLAVTTDGRGIAHWWVSYRVPTRSIAEENDGIFIVSLAEDGRCREFREWWNARERAERG